MPVPLESNFLVPNAIFVVASSVALALVVLVVGALVWFVVGRRGAAAER